MSMSSQTLSLGELLVFPVFKTGKSSMAKTKKRLLCFDVEEKVLVKKDRTKVLRMFPFSSILSYVSDGNSLLVTVEFVRQIRNSQETRKSYFISQNEDEQQALVAVLHCIIHNDWTYIFSTTQTPLENLNKPPPGLSTIIVGRGNLLMRGSKSNFENVLVTCVWGKLFIQQASSRKRVASQGTTRKRGISSGGSGSGSDACPNTCQTERAFSLVNGSLAVPDGGGGRIDVVTPTHRLQFLVDAKSELGHDKWLKGFAQSIAIYDLDLKYFIDFGEMVKRQSRAGRSDAATKPKATTTETLAEKKMAGTGGGSSSSSGKTAPEGLVGSPRKKEANNDRTSSIPYVRQSDGGGVMLARHYILNFTVAFVPPLSCKSINAREKNELGQCRAVLHLDTLRKAVEIFVKGTNVLTFKLQNLVKCERGSEGSFPSLCIHYTEDGAKEGTPATRIWLFYQAFHEIEVCTEVFANALAGEKTKQPDLQRTIIKQGSIEKKGKSRIYGQRYAVLVPNKLILLRSKTAYIPLQVITFGSESRLWDVGIDESDRSVLNMNPKFSKNYNHTSLEDSIGNLMNTCISLRFKDATECSSWHDMLLKQSNKRVGPKKTLKLSQVEEKGEGEEGDDAETNDPSHTEPPAAAAAAPKALPNNISRPSLEVMTAPSPPEDHHQTQNPVLVDADEVGEEKEREEEKEAESVTRSQVSQEQETTPTATSANDVETTNGSSALEEEKKEAVHSERETDQQEMMLEEREEERQQEEVGEAPAPAPAPSPRKSSIDQRGEEEGPVHDECGPPAHRDTTVKNAFEFWGVQKKARE